MSEFRRARNNRPSEPDRTCDRDSGHTQSLAENRAADRVELFIGDVHALLVRVAAE